MANKNSSEFILATQDKDADAVWWVIDELASSVQLVVPRMYEATIEKLRAI